MLKVAVCACFVIVLLYVCVSCGENELEFKSVPTTVKAHENNSVLLPCYLETTNNDGAHGIRIRWYLNGAEFADSGPPPQLPPERFKLWENGSLEVVNVKPQDTGEYMCEIIRPEPWSPVRQVHAIEVLHPPSIKQIPEEGFLEVKLGEEAEMTCLPSGVPHPVVTWSYKGEVMQLRDSRETLKFTASDRNLAGSYECTAANGVGQPAKSEIELNIIYPPEVMSTRSWIHTAPDLRVQLECKVSSDPQAIVTWLKGEIPVPLDNRVLTLIDGDKHTLLIRKVVRSDFGIYTCRATNDLGQGELQIQLSGVPNPGVFKRTDDKNLESVNSYTLIWEVDSYTPIIEYSLWFRRHNPKSSVSSKPDWTKLTIPTEHNTNAGHMHSKLYTIKGLKEKTIYEALLVSRNRYGWSKPSPILRFATAGTDLKEEIITPLITETETNIIPDDNNTSIAPLPLSNHYTSMLITAVVLYNLI